jgi:transmembrane sensor
MMSNQGVKRELSPTEREAVAWYWKLQEKDLPVSEWHRFQRWNAVAAHRESFDAVATVWEQQYRAHRISRARHTSQVSARRVLWRLARAAIVVLIVGLLASNMSSAPQMLRTGRTTAAVVLDDGSILRAAPDTKVAIYFDASNRSIYLFRGQAFFRVAEDPQRPFIVRTPLSTSRALGTRFSVSFIEDVSEVSVLEGIVAVLHPVHSETTGLSPSPVELRAGQQIRASSTSVGVVHPMDSVRTLSWATTIDFSDTPITQAIEDFNRLNGLHVELLSPPATENVRVSGTYQLDQPASFAQYISDVTSAPVGLHMPGRNKSMRVMQPRTWHRSDPVVKP